VLQNLQQGDQVSIMYGANGEILAIDSSGAAQSRGEIPALLSELLVSMIGVAWAITLWKLHRNNQITPRLATHSFPQFA